MGGIGLVDNQEEEQKSGAVLDEALGAGDKGEAALEDRQDDKQTGRATLKDRRDDDHTGRAAPEVNFSQSY